MPLSIIDNTKITTSNGIIAACNSLVAQSITIKTRYDWSAVARSLKYPKVIRAINNTRRLMAILWKKIIIINDFKIIFI